MTRRLSERKTRSGEKTERLSVFYKIKQMKINISTKK